MTGRYIYGIIERSEAESFGSIGINGGEVYTISGADIACLVSDSPFFDYRSMPKPDVGTHISIYQSVIEQVMKNYTLIPVKFGTIAKNEDEVREILLKGYQELRETLDKMENKIEFDVVVLWSEFDSVLKEIGEEKEIKALKAKIAGQEQALSLQDKIKIGQAVKSILDKRRDEILEFIQNALNRIAIDTCGSVCLGDKMIMNTAFLIEKEKETQFDKTLNELDNRLQGKVNFRCVGPLPPYSFSQIEVKRIEKKALKNGMAILGLESSAEVHPRLKTAEIKKAYRIMARRYHPDMLGPGGAKGDERFKELTQAYELLLDYSQGIEKVKNPAKGGTIIIKL